MLVEIQQAILVAKKKFAEEFGSLDDLSDGECFTAVFEDGVIILRTIGKELHIEVVETVSCTVPEATGIFV